MKKLIVSLLLAVLPLSSFAASGTAIPGGNQSTPFNIDKPGAYYLAGNRTMTDTGAWGAIVINADNVTLDLNGFTLAFTSAQAAGSGSHAVVSSGENVEVRNGTISTVPGPAVRSAQGYGFRLVDVRVLNSEGLYITEAGALIERCTITNSRRFGIYLAGTGSIVRNCTVTDVSSTASYNGIGINMGADCHVTGCTIAYVDWAGIDAGQRCVIEDCKVSSTNLNKDGNKGGIYVQGSSTTVRRNVINGSGCAGIYISAYATNVIVDQNIINRTSFATGGTGGPGIWSHHASTVVRGNLGGANAGSFISGQYTDGGGNLGN